MRIVIRTELNEQSGIGHFVRMRSLLQWLSFYSVESEVYVQGDNTTGEFFHRLIPSISSLRCVNVNIISQNGDNPKLDASLKDIQNVECLLVDSYAIDDSWLRYASGLNPNVLLLDDNPENHRVAPVIIDSTLNSDRSAPLKAFLGGQYFFASPELARLHFEKVLQSNSVDDVALSRVSNIFIGFGGSDNKKLLPDVIRHLASEVSPETHLYVAVVDGIEHEAEVQLALARWPGTYDRVSDHRAVLQALVCSQVAIGAAGGAFFERALLGIPSIVVMVADNQSSQFKALEENQLALAVENGVCHDSSLLVSILRSYLLDSQKRTLHITNGFSISKGLGASWIAQWMTRSMFQGIYLQLAEGYFKEKLFEWQSNPDVRKYSRSSRSPTWEEHSTWFDQFVNQEASLLCQVMSDEWIVGMVRLEPTGNSKLDYEVSIIVDPNCQGRGYGLMAIERVKQLVPFLNLFAYIKPENRSSVKLFTRCGFVAIESDWYRYRTNWQSGHFNNVH